MHAVLVHLELGFVAIGISCYFHKPTNLQGAPTMMARGDMKSCCLELEAVQTKTSANISNSHHRSSWIYAILLCSHLPIFRWKTCNDLMKNAAAMGLGWIIHQIHGSQCFSSSSGQNLSQEYASWSKNVNQETTVTHKKQKPWMDSKKAWKRCNFEWESCVPSWCFNGFNIKEPHVHLCVEHPTHDGIRLTGRQKIPWAADTLSFENGTWFYVLFLNDGF